jgi:hypothetical protein
MIDDSPDVEPLVDDRESQCHANDPLAAALAEWR